MNHNIIITSAGKRVALVKYFKETLQNYYPDSKVFTTDMNPQMAPAGYVSDKCFAVPRVTDENYIDTLLQICKNNNISLIIPTIDTELIILSKVKDLFLKDNIIIIISDFEFINYCRDKRNTETFFRERNIRIPQERDIKNPIFPIFAKPYDGSLSTNLHIINSKEDITTEILNDPKLIFMELIDKKNYKEYTVDMYFGKDNKIKCIVPRERIQIRAGEINQGKTHKNYIIDYLKEHIGYIKGCIGCICMQLFYNPIDNEIVAIEINPRFGGGYPLSYASGANFIKFIILEYFQNKNIEYFDNWKDGMLMLRYDDAIFI